jgi:prepilin-type processing-associated H-X9-DG protein
MNQEFGTTPPPTLDYASPRTKAGWRMSWITIVVILFALVGAGAVLMPALGKAKCGCGKPQCGTNEHQIVTAIYDYAQKHDGAAPPSMDVLRNGFASSTTSNNIFHCPVGKGDYVYVGFGINMHSARKGTILHYEPPSTHKDSKTGKGAMNVAYVDGSVRTVVQPQADRVIAELKAGHNPPREEMIN